MQEFIQIHDDNSTEIDNYIHDSIVNLGEIRYLAVDNFETLFKVFNSLELVYVCDSESMTQVSNNLYRNKIDKEAKGVNRELLVHKLEFDENGIAITRPYTSNATGKACVTVVKKEGNRLFFLDFTLVTVLEKLGLIEIHKEFNFINKSFYSVSTAIMMVLATFAIGYALYAFVNSIFIEGVLSIESIFKPVIALTLGIAIFDLAKTILEQEVLFKSYSKNSQSEYKVLTKFSVTIMIALLIESLMVVFKIAMNDYSQMIHAVYLIGVIAVLLVSLGIFIYLTKK